MTSLSLIAPAALQAVLLFIVSRLLFVWVVSSVADGRGRGFLLGLLRFPGNLVHEYSHCLGFWLGGYRVRRVLLCVFDRQGRGACTPGKPWLPVTAPWVAMGVAALMPLVAGSLILALAARHLGITQAPIAPQEGAQALVVLYQSTALLQALDWSRWQTYLFLYLALSIGAELSPSSVDLRYGLPAIIGLAAGAWLFFFSVQRAPGLQGVGQAAAEWLAVGSAWLAGVLGVALMLTTAVLLVSAIPALMLRAARQR